MGPAASTALGIFTGLIVFLAMAMMGVIAVNGTDNPGVTRFSGAAQVSAAGGSTAESRAEEPKRGSFHSLDLNRDGALSFAEVAGYAEIVTRFERADRDKDGKLTQAEFERLAKLPPPKAGKSKNRAAKKAPSREEATAAAGG
jgi:hypothetical protein